MCQNRASNNGIRRDFRQLWRACWQALQGDAHRLTETLFIRMLAIVYFIAFVSLQRQIIGLAGEKGVAPAADLINKMRNLWGLAGFWNAPSLFWWEASDHLLTWACALGIVSSIILFLGFAQRICLILCFVLYLSFVSVVQPFLSFQWDALLLESGFLAMFIGSPIVVWAYRFLLFRLLFESGFAKLASGDPTWHNLTALRYHFETQPLPTIFAWYANQASPWVLCSLAFLTLAIELGTPFLLFAPRKLRYAGAALNVILQICIALTGNYTFFNLLTVSLCLWALDDRVVTYFQPLSRVSVRPIQLPFLRRIASVCLLLLMALGAASFASLLWPASAQFTSHITNVASRWQIVNRYGLFAIMTTSRPEVVLEASIDGQTWKEYAFQYKPGDMSVAPKWVAPFQPRLDWQMWFAALGSYQENPWVLNLVARLLENEPSVRALFACVPFEQPPLAIRALLYDYTFTTQNEREQTGRYWNRKLKGIYFPPVQLKRQELP